MAKINGDSADNVIYSSWQQDDLILGGSGSDTITSHDGSDVLRGQRGDDFFRVAMHPGDTVVKGGTGIDSVRVYNFDGEISIRRDGADLIISDQGGTLTIKGNVERYDLDI